MTSLGKSSLALAVLLLASRAHASPNYPEAVQGYLGKGASIPPCTLCHSSDLGGPGTVSTPFGHAVLSHGASGKNDVGALRAALAEMDSESDDSDCDGVPDLDELRSGGDPNAGPCQGGLTAQTGCALRPAASEPAAVGFVELAVLGVWAGVLRLRAKRRRRRHG